MWVSFCVLATGPTNVRNRNKEVLGLALVEALREGVEPVRLCNKTPQT